MRTVTYTLPNGTTTTSLAEARGSERYKVSLVAETIRGEYNAKRVAAIREKARVSNDN